jgi:hypothetical protein
MMNQTIAKLVREIFPEEGDIRLPRVRQGLDYRVNLTNLHYTGTRNIVILVVRAVFAKSFTALWNAVGAAFTLQALGPLRKKFFA